MAGSLRWFVYVTDDDTQYALKLDESNTELINGAAAAVSVAGLTASLPRNIKPRQIIYRDASQNYTRRVVALTLAAYEAITAASTFTFAVEGSAAGVLMGPALKKGEIISLPSTVDTGLIDGDQP